MDFVSQLVPAVILLVSNLMSGPHNSARYERVTAVFGWVLIVTVPMVFIVSFVAPKSPAKPFLSQVMAFSILTVLARDYERILRRFFPWNR